MAHKRRQDANKFTPEQFDKLVTDYIKMMSAQDKIPTRAHCAMHIGISRQQLVTKYKTDEKFSATYEKLETAFQAGTEQAAMNPEEGDRRHAGVLVFMLKNAGYTDRQEIDHTTGGQQINQWSVLPVSSEKNE